MRNARLLGFLPIVFVLGATQGGVAAGAASDPGQNDLASRLSNRGLSASEILRILRGFEIAPVPLNLHNKDLVLVGTGSYIVNAQAACNDCHTNPPFAPGGDPFAGEPEQINVEGYLAGGASFGPFITRNLTPDSSGRPAGLTYQEFRRTLRTGVDLKAIPPPVPAPDNDLLQVMPWPVHRNMIERDLRAVYEYLKAIPSRPGFPRD